MYHLRVGSSIRRKWSVLSQPETVVVVVSNGYFVVWNTPLDQWRSIRDSHNACTPWQNHAVEALNVTYRCFYRSRKRSSIDNFGGCRTLSLDILETLRQLTLSARCPSFLDNQIFVFLGAPLPERCRGFRSFEQRWGFRATCASRDRLRTLLHIHTW